MARTASGTGRGGRAGTAAARRRGRPPAGASAAQREVVLEATVALLAERGYQATTMAAVAERAGSSKETLYAWFGSKQGLFTALVRRQAEATNQAVAAALDHPGGPAGPGGGTASDRSGGGAAPEPEEVLTGFAVGLLGLLLGERSVAINRAALADPDGGLAAVLLAEGRHRTGPMVEAYLARLAAEGRLGIDDPGEAFQLLYGLVVRDLQIRVLLGERPPGPAALRAQAGTAVARFLTLTGGRPAATARPGRPG
jgi:AcrR family transcriptional regulator